MPSIKSSHGHGYKEDVNGHRKYNFEKNEMAGPGPPSLSPALWAKKLSDRFEISYLLPITTIRFVGRALRS